MISRVDWDLYRSFLAVMRHGSLSGAARAVGATQPTIGRHIEALETSLSLALFTRSQGGLTPTPGATVLVAQAEAMEAAAAALQRAADGARDQDGGTVRVTASEIMGAEVLPAILAEFQEANPRIVVELVLSNRNDDLLRRDADIAVRMNRPAQDALLVKHIGRLGLGLFAHERYISRHGTPQSLEALKDFHVIGFDRHNQSARAIAAGTIELDRSMFSLRTDSDLAQFAAVRAGLGIGAVQHRLAARHPTLRPVLQAQLGFHLELWLAMHEDQRSNRPIRLMFAALADGLRRWVAGHEGNLATPST